MSFTPKVLVAQQYVENAALTLKYTSPLAGKGTWIDKAVFTNISGSAATLTVNIVPSGGSAGNDNKVIPGQSIAAGVVTSVAELAGKFIGPGDAIHWQASAGSAINGAINGREVT